MYVPMSLWFTAFALTLAVEVPVVLFLVRRSAVASGRVVALVVFANLATHPVVWFVLTQLFVVGTLA